MSIKITVVADICPTINGNEIVEEQILNGSAKNLIKPVLPQFEQSDIVIGNLEAAVYNGNTPIDKYGPPLAMKCETAKRIKEDMGFSGFTLANNHIYDHGYEGLKSTVEFLQKEKIPYCGADLTHEDACKPMVFEVKGKSVAFFNFAEGEYAEAQYNDAGTARLDSFFAYKRVMDGKKKYDYVIAILHIGNEHIAVPSPDTINRCRAMAEAGADAVISHHAHIPQFTEVYKGVPICYSLGNFMFGKKFDKNGKANWHLCTVADITLDDAAAKMNILPFRQLEDLALHELGEKGKKIIDDYFNKCKEICDNPEVYRKIWEQELRGRFGKNIVAGFLTTVTPFTTGSEEDRKKAIGLQFNIFNCASHKERFARALRLVYDGKEESDPEAEAVINELHEMLKKVLFE